jgi:hypothetical protein
MGGVIVSLGISSTLSLFFKLNFSLYTSLLITYPTLVGHDFEMVSHPLFSVKVASGLWLFFERRIFQTYIPADMEFLCYPRFM